MDLPLVGQTAVPLQERRNDLWSPEHQKLLTTGSPGQVPQISTTVRGEQTSDHQQQRGWEAYDRVHDLAMETRNRATDWNRFSQGRKGQARRGSVEIDARPTNARLELPSKSPRGTANGQPTGWELLADAHNVAAVGEEHGRNVASSVGTRLYTGSLRV